MSTDDAFARALKGMSLPELHALWAAELDGRLAITPHERAARLYRKRKREVFIERMARCPVTEQSRIHLELTKGTDPDEVFRGMSAPPQPTKKEQR
jgi:hypothetical protein